jgi:hypothetical protein
MIHIDQHNYGLGSNGIASLQTVHSVENVLIRSTLVVRGSYFKVLTISPFAFGRSSIERVLIPKTLEIIRSHSFSRCPRIRSFGFESNSNLKDIAEHAFSSSGISAVHIPRLVRRISPEAFSDCPYLGSVSFESNGDLVSIGKSAFSGCNISWIQIPRTVRILDEFCFRECFCLTAVKFEFGSVLREIRHCAFSRTSLNEIQIPETVLFIAGTALEALSCINLQSTSFYGLESPFVLTRDRRAIVTSFGVHLNVNIPDEIEVLEDGCFIRSSSLTRICFSAGSCVRRIGKSAFQASTLHRINIPSSVEMLDSECFSWCEMLVICIFDENSRCKEIGESTFSHTALTSIRIPGTVEHIGRRCFSGSRALAEIEFEGTSELTSLRDQAFSNTSVSEFEIPLRLVNLSGLMLEGIKMISLAEGHSLIFDGELLFDSTQTILIRAFSPSDYLIIPACVETIGKFSFSRIDSLSDVQFETSSRLTRIEEGAFSGSSIRELILPRNVPFIDKTAFEWCRGLKIESE